MHMADALISPVVGGTMLAVSVGTMGFAARKLKNELTDSKIPLMGVMGAFVFAAQMINFSIPGTGSSGHIGGGMLLAALLGTSGGFLAMAAILLLQALFFADGGLLAYGCNLFNLGFFTCFLAYPLIFKPIINKVVNRKRIIAAALISVISALQAGAFSVVLQTTLSGKTELPFFAFLAVMQPIHLAISVVEGLVTAAIIVFIWNTRPDLLDFWVKEEQRRAAAHNPTMELNCRKSCFLLCIFGNKLQNGSVKRNNKYSQRVILSILIIITLLLAGGLSLFASQDPDGLEWSMEKVAGNAGPDADSILHKFAMKIQEYTAIFPDYNFKKNPGNLEGEEAAPSINAAGVIGGITTLGLVLITGFILYFFKNSKKANEKEKTEKEQRKNR